MYPSGFALPIVDSRRGAALCIYLGDGADLVVVQLLAPHTRQEETREEHGDTRLHWLALVSTI